MKIAVASSIALGKEIVDCVSQLHEVSYCITTPDSPKGRSATPVPNDFAQSMVGSPYQLFKPQSKAEIDPLLTSKSVDIVITLAYGMLIPSLALKQPRFGWLNIHFSLLPKWRGASPVQSSLLAHERQGGYTIFQLDEGLDTGPIFYQGSYTYPDDAKTSEILSALTFSSVQVLPKILNNIESGCIPKPQVGDPGPHARKFSSTDGKIVTSMSVQDAYVIYKALSENPGVFLENSRTRIKIVEAKYELDSDALPGQWVVSKNQLKLGFVGGYLILERVTPSGKRTMTGLDFMRGARIDSGDLFESL